MRRQVRSPIGQNTPLEVHQYNVAWRAYECRYFAFLQIKTIVSTMIRHYDIEWKDQSWQPKIDYSQIVATPPPSHVTIKRRAKPVGGAMF